MDVTISDEQGMLVDLAADVASDVAGRWTLGRTPEESVHAVAPADVKLVAEAGLFGLRHGGEDRASWVDVCLVAEQFGRHVAPVPFLGPVVAVEMLQALGADDAVVSAVVSADQLMTVGVTKDLSRFADSVDDAVAWDSAGSTSALVLSERGAEAYALQRDVHTVDFTRGMGSLGSAMTIALPEAVGPETRARLSAMAMTAISADLLGVMGAAMDAAVEHAKSRRQFGTPIGSFQAIQHLLADSLVSVEAVRSAVWYAGWAAESLSSDDALVAARTAKAFASMTAVEVVESAMQVFGGMSQTWESMCHLWLRRARVDRLLFGDEHSQHDALSLATPGHGVS